MKKVAFLLAGCAVVLSVFAGCQKANKVIEDNAVKVTVAGDGKFPEFLAGTWKADNDQWEFTFEPDGTISSAVIDSGMIKVTPGWKTATFKLDKGTGEYKFGDWSAAYTPDSRELAVEVVVDEYTLSSKSVTMKGHSTDWFVGPVSEDKQSWKADWYTFIKVVASSQGEDDVVFDDDPNGNPVATLVFTKQQ